MRSTPTASLGLRGLKADLPPLAHYRPRALYIPQYGDYVIWSRWLSTWHGVIRQYDKDTDDLYIIFAGVPYLLFVMSGQEQEKETYKIKLSEIRSAKNGKYAIQHHDKQANTGIWYI